MSPAGWLGGTEWLPELPFLCTYLCEQDFAALSSIKMKRGNKINADHCLIPACTHPSRRVVFPIKIYF